MSTAKKRAKRERLCRDQGGRCYWCNCQMVEPGPDGWPSGARVPPNGVTVEHLDSKLSGQRGAFKGQRRVVAACKACNQARADREVEALELERKWEQSQRFPRWVARDPHARGREERKRSRERRQRRKKRGKGLH